MALVRLVFVGTLSTAWCCSALPAEPASAPPSLSASPAPDVPSAAAPSGGQAASPGPAEATKPTPPPVVPTRSAGFETSQDYVLQPGDDLQISVWKETDLTAEIFIRPDGGISFPLAGDLPAAGMTVAELTAALEKRVRRYEPDAVVTVMVKAAIGNRVYVIGKVNKPGDFALNRPIEFPKILEGPRVVFNLPGQVLFAPVGWSGTRGVSPTATLPSTGLRDLQDSPR